MRATVGATLVLAACGDPCDRPGTICTIAGMPGEAGLGSDDTPALESPLYLPEDVDVAPDGTIYIADDNNHAIRAVDADAVMHIVAGGVFLGDGPDGDARTSSLNHPASISVDPEDPSLVWVAATGNHRIKLLDVDEGTIRVIAGTGEPGFVGDGGLAENAELMRPSSAVVGADGRLYVSDKVNQVIRCVQQDDHISTYAGQPSIRGYSGDGGPPGAATLHAPEGQEYDPGNRITSGLGALWVADTGNHVIRRIDVAIGLIDTVAGRAAPGYDPDLHVALSTRLNLPHDVALGPTGELYIADTGNHCVRVLHLDGTIDDFAGVCGETGFAGDGDDALLARLAAPGGIGVDARGDVYIADTQNHVVRRVRAPR
ncbi:MAG TPA: hypothetical protein PKA64_03930 [Myxococcota bacterium]|nr:hypothetical protein [Myxococcota bacterium]